MKCVMCLIGNVKIFYSVDENDALKILKKMKTKAQLDTENLCFNYLPLPTTTPTTFQYFIAVNF